MYVERTGILKTKEALIWKLLFWGVWGWYGRKTDESVRLRRTERRKDLRTARFSCLSECS